MKKLSALALIAFLSVGGTCVRAQGSLALDESSANQFEFLRDLRQKGYAAQANEYIDILLKSADKTTAPLLNLEKARNTVALAKEGKSLEEKAKLLGEAKAFFEPFVKGNAKTAAAAQARTELAKLLSIQAQMTLNKALAADEPVAKEAGAKAARGLYDAADAEFKQSVAVLKELAKSSKQYEAELVQSEFDQANNLIDKAQAFVDLNDSAQNRTRAETVAAAAKIFLPIAAKKDTAQGLLANAYLVKVSQENQDPTKVIDYVNIVNKPTEKFAEPAQRLAAYYDLSWMPQNPNARQVYKENLYKKQVEFCDEWLKSYPAYRRSYNGEAVRFEEAQACLKVAAQMSDGLKPEKIAKLDKKTRAEFDGYFNNAKKLSEELDKEKGDFAERGASFHSYIVELELKNGLSVVNNSGTMVLRASMEFQAAVKAASDPERQKHLRTGLSMLENAIARAYDEKLPASKLHEYEFIQGSVYFGINDFHRAAVSFEALARELPPSKKGAEAAEQALQIYKTLADKESDKSARERLHDLADYVFRQKTWEAEPVQGFARYDLAMDYLTEENYAEALKQFALLPKEFPGYTYAQGQALFIAMSARKADETPEGKKTWTSAAKKAIDRMGPLPADANATTSLMWFYAACEGPKFHYADGKSLFVEPADFLKAEKLNEAEKDFLAMKKNVGEISDTFKKYGDKLDPQKKEGVKFTIEVLDKYWRLGLADIAYRRARYADVISNDLLGATLGKLVEEYLKDPNKAIKVKDVDVMVQSVNLGLRTFVQFGKLDEAKAMYNIMLKLDSEEGGTSKTALTRSLIADLADQVKGLKDKKDDAKLKEMVTKFSGFVDDLADQLVKNNKAPENRDIKNLAKFYGSLGLYKKASDLFKGVPTPKFLETLDPAKVTKEQDAELWAYWDMQVEYGRLLRESKEFKEANKVFVRILNHKNGRKQLDAEEEQNSIYEDMDSYGNAIKGWKTYMEGIQRSPKFSTDVQLKEKYFKGFYRNVLCFYKLSQLPKMAPKEDQYLTYAANQIVRLETAQSHEGWSIIGPRFQELLTKEKKLRDKYQTLKK